MKFRPTNIPFFIGLPTATVALLSAGSAKAILNYYIYQQGPDVKIDAIGNVILPEPFDASACYGGSVNNGKFAYSNSGFNAICTGLNETINLFKATISANTTNFVAELNATSTTATRSTALGWGPIYATVYGASVFGVEDSGTANKRFSSSSLFANTNLATDFGLTTTGLLTSLTLLPADSSDPYTANDTINIYVGPPPPEVPGPLPLMGAGAAYAFCRRLRSRIRCLGPQAKP